MQTDYDFAILGGGAAGLSLALALTRSPLRDSSILVVEKEAKDGNDRTWCFWTDQPGPLDGIVRRAWRRLRFLSPGFDRTWDLGPFRYLMLRGLDFYDHARAELQKHDVTFLRAAAEAADGEHHARVSAAGTEVRARYVFDSRPPPAGLDPDPRYTFLKQHFLGWEVETDAPVFDPEVATLFDLRTPQRGGVTFFYVLPVSERRALVEYTLFSPDLLSAADYETALGAYLGETLGLKNYTVLARERGVIPMTDRPFPRRLGRRILAIGTRGGRVKPSTGYAFARIQRDSERIVASLLHRGHPFALPPDPLRFRLHDAVMLEVLRREPDFGRPILSAIFTRNPIGRVLRFLDDRSSWWQDLAVMAAHPPGPFLRAIGRLLARRSGLSRTPR